MKKSVKTAIKQILLKTCSCIILDKSVEQMAEYIVSNIIIRSNDEPIKKY